MGKVSIIIPVYNVEKYIDKCLESIINQTYENYEIILVDDGSSDDSYNIIKSWQKKYNDVIICLKQKNKGAGAARNRGLEVAKGDFIVFVDSDDYLDNDFLEVMVSNINDNDIVISGSRHVSENSVLYTRKLKEDDWTKFQQLVIWAKIYRTEFIKKNKLLFSDIKTGQDVVFSLECYSHEPNVKIIDYVGYNNYHNLNSITHNKKIQIDNNVIAMYDYILNNIKDTKFFENNIKDITFFFYKDIIARLSRKSEFINKKDLFELEVVYYDWLMKFLDTNNLKFKFIYMKGEKKIINIIVFCYILSRKIGLKNLFLNFLYLKRYN